MTPEESIEFLQNFHDPKWRLNSGMYMIKVKDTVENPKGMVKFKPNPTQMDFLKNIHYRNIVCKARQLGFTSLTCIMWLDYALFNQNVNCGIVAQSDVAATAFFRDKVKFAYEHLDPEIKKMFPLKADSSNELIFAHNLSSIRVATSFASATIHRLLVSEYGKICSQFPEKATEIVIGTLPTVPENGIIIIESTGEGAEGDFHARVVNAQAAQLENKPLTDKDYKLHFYPWFIDKGYTMSPEGVEISLEDSIYFNRIEEEMESVIDAGQRAWYISTRKNSFSDDEIRMFSQYPSTPNEPFFVSNEGNYFRKEMAAVRKSGRICKIPEIDVPVNTFWDVGNSDGCAIWFHQQVGLEDRFIGYYEAHGEKLSVYMKELRDRGYIYNKHFLPHDASHKRLSDTNNSIKEMLEDLGLQNIVIVPKVTDLMTGIQMVKANFPSVYFDLSCKEGINRLDNYKKKWNQRDERWSDEPNKANGCSEGCLVGDTKVLLRTGLTEIKNVIVGDEVWTPAGYALVLASGIVKKAHELVRIQFSNGNELICTPEHKIMTQKGFVYADALSLYDEVFQGGELKCLTNSLLSMVTNIGFRQVTTRVKTGGALKFIVGCNVQYGQLIMEKFQMGMKFITLTLTQPIMTFQTFHAYQCTTTSDFTHSNGLKMEHSNHQAQKLYGWQHFGTQVQKVLNGTAIMVRKLGKTESSTKSNAQSATQSLKHHTQQEQNTAQEGANTYLDASEMVKQKNQSSFVGSMSENNSQKNKLTARNTLANALSVIKSFLRHTLQELFIAPKGVHISHISTAKVGRSGVYVYDLKVQKHQCYQAAGIIVSNSDAIRQWAQAKSAGNVTPIGSRKRTSEKSDVHNTYSGYQGWMG